MSGGKDSFVIGASISHSPKLYCELMTKYGVVVCLSACEPMVCIAIVSQSFYRSQIFTDCCVGPEQHGGK